MTFEEKFPPDSGVPKVMYDAFREVWDSGKKEGIEEYEQKVREVVTAYLCKYMCEKYPRIQKARDGIMKELGL